jgi:aspartate aminotransferase
MAQGRLSPPGIAQFIAIGADSLGDDYTTGVVAEYQRRRDVLYEGLTSIPGVSLAKPEGAFYCMPRLPIDDCDEFASWLLSDYEKGGETVMVAPARGFYATPGLGADQVRIAYVLKEDDLRRAVDVLAGALEAYAREHGPSRRVKVSSAQADRILPQGT